MTKAKVAVAPGKLVAADRLEFKAISEPWSEFECEDGTRLRVRLLVSEIFRLEDQRTQEGDPVYLVKSTNLMTVEVPESLRQLPTRSTGSYA